ncbi:hypothetical protein [Winogradskyella poriferorum]|uniref:hypothetical protein n=1 Tax=Winogradskyella poriferorum TaxID=307627 RepID=UPI003D65B30C
MSRLESNASIKGLRKGGEKKSTTRPKVTAALTILGLSGLLTLSYMNGNIFMEHIAVCGFIITCVAIIKLMETN